MHPCRLKYSAIILLVLLAGCGGSGAGSSTGVLPGGTSNHSQVPVPAGGVRITEYSLAGITSGNVNSDGVLLPDGTLWLNDGGLLHVTPTGAKIAELPIFDPTCSVICNLASGGLTYHPSNNSLWYGVFHAVGTLSSTEVDWIDATTMAHEGATTTSDGDYSQPINGPDGRVWTSDCGSGGVFGGAPFCELLAINPVTAATSMYDLGSDHFAPLITPSAHRSLYVFETDQFAGTPQLVELSTSGIELHRFAAPDNGILDMTEGADGNLWMLDSQLNEVIKMTPSGQFTQYAVSTPRAGLDHLLRVTDGNIWFTEINADKIGRITAGGSITEFPVPTAVAAPDGIMGVDASTCAISPHGFFYITENHADALARVDF